MLLHVSAMLSSFSKRADVSGSSHATPPEVAVGGRSSRLRWRRGGPAALEAASEKRNQRSMKTFHGGTKEETETVEGKIVKEWAKGLRKTLKSLIK